MNIEIEVLAALKEIFDNMPEKSKVESIKMRHNPRKEKK